MVSTLYLIENGIILKSEFENKENNDTNSVFLDQPKLSGPNGFIHSLEQTVY